jgi:hypothetical protein
VPKDLHLRVQRGVVLDARLHVELPRQVQSFIHKRAQDLQLEPGWHQLFLRGAPVDHVVYGRPKVERRYS